MISTLLARFSMRTSLIATILAMSALGLVLTLVFGEIYRDFANESQRQIIVEQARSVIVHARKHFEVEMQGVAAAARQDRELVAAARRGDAAPARARLADLARRVWAVHESGRPVLAVFDPNHKSLAVSIPGGPERKIGSVICNNQHAPSFAAGPGATPRMVSGLCVDGGGLYHVAVIPLGDGSGYLQAVAEMLPYLTILERDMGLPLRLSLADGTVLHKSPSWPAAEADEHALMGELQLNAYAPKRAVVNVAVSKNVREFHEQLEATKYAVMGVAVLATLLAGFIGLQALHATAIKPLRALAAQLRRIQQDKGELGKEVHLNGNAEIVELGTGFNAMTTRLRDLYEKFERMAFTDALTQLPNRVMLLERLRREIVQARDGQKSFALLIMDLDHFKEINDTLGHHIGDVLLQQIGVRLRAKLRESDMLARMGGDEFALILPHVDDKQAAMAARMLLQGLRAPFMVDEQRLDVGASVGIALYPDHGVDANTLIQRADVAMYAAKRGNGGYAFYDGKQDKHHPRHLAFLGELRHAVEQEQFTLYYQPIVDLQTGQVCAAEALVRLPRPQEDLMLPDRFIPLMEQTGMIRGLTPWVLGETLREGAVLNGNGTPLIISMNLSMRDLQDPFLVDSFSEMLASHKSAAEWLQLEITESAVMTDPAHVLEVLKRLSAMGLKLALDDFGTGYSSMTYLKKLPLDTIKVDKSFVIGMSGDANDAAIVRTSIDLAHNFGRTVIAEGVENAEALQKLKDFGCDMAQGLYISRPLPAAELQEWLAKSSWGPRKKTVKYRYQHHH